MHRFFLSPEHCQTPAPVLDGREAHHALHVLRIKPGETVEILDGQGGRLKCLVRQCERRSLSLEVRDRQHLPRTGVPCVLYQGLLKPKAMEWVLQKAAELGTSRIVPLQTRHAVARVDQEAAKLDKWSWILIDALKQSGGPWLPLLDPPQSLATCLATELPELSLAASLQSSCHPRRRFQDFRSDHQRPPRSVGVWIGPEGDFAAEEMSQLHAGGVRDITLGPRVLRSETAALCALALVQYELSD